MFVTLRVILLVYYIVTVSIFLAILYHFMKSEPLEQLWLLGVVLFCLITLSAILLSKLALDPLKERLSTLESFSKETLHELNLPIATINTTVSLLKKNLSDEKSLSRFKRIEGACAMLQERYNELDYLIKAQSNKITKERFELKSLIEARVSFFSYLHPHATFELNLEARELLSDKIGLGKVIDNLLDNALKYSQKTYKVAIQLQQNSLSIQDFGKGMDGVELLHIYDRYYQGDEQAKGFGIGLSMVKRFCDENNIALTIASKPNEGTTITLDFKEEHK